MHWQDGKGFERFVIWWPTGGYRTAVQKGHDIYQSTEKGINGEYPSRAAAQAELDAYAVGRRWKQIWKEGKEDGAIN
jgi:hypothetical protein